MRRNFNIIIVSLTLAIALLSTAGCEVTDIKGDSYMSYEYSEALSNIDSDTQSGNVTPTGPSRYNFEEYIQPVWEGTTVYNETVLMLKDDGLPKASLLYTPDKILSVKSPDLSIIFEEGKDYTVNGNIITLTENTGAIYLEKEEIYPSVSNERSIPKRGGGFLSISLESGKKFCEVQLAVTYTHTENGFGDYEFPKFADDKLPKTIEKLRNKEDLKYILYGDSIAAGAETSGFYDIYPKMPSWGTLIWLSLYKEYQSNIALKIHLLEVNLQIGEGIML